LASVHRNGPGLRIIGRERWYGPGYCGICGSRDVVPVAVRYWDPDDGWRMGVLCGGCGEDCSERGPRPDDYACRTTDIVEQAQRIDVLSELVDLDGAYADQMD
jgi:hypothetical protein